MNKQESKLFVRSLISSTHWHPQAHQKRGLIHRVSTKHSTQWHRWDYWTRDWFTLRVKETLNYRKPHFRPQSLPFQTFQFFAVVGVGVAGKPGDKPLHVSLTDPTPAPVARNAILLSFLLPHLQMRHESRRGMRKRGMQKQQKNEFGETENREIKRLEVIHTLITNCWGKWLIAELNKLHQRALDTHTHQCFPQQCLTFPGSKVSI